MSKAALEQIIRLLPHSSDHLYGLSPLPPALIVKALCWAAAQETTDEQ